MSTFRSYYMLTKPGIIMGNLVTAAAGLALASKGHIDYLLFFITLLGLSFIIASACVCNNYLDRDMDQKMARTKNRPLVKGVISVQNALAFAAVLGGLGTLVLGVYTNFITTCAALTGFFAYVVLYGVWKYRSIHGTLIGSIAGAVPPVVGYTAVTNSLDLGAFLLFIIVMLWQMPHFYAIAMYRLEDYAAASIPVLPVIKGAYETKVHMLLYVIAFIVAALSLPFFGYTGYGYMTVCFGLGAIWLWVSIQGFTSSNDRLWARKMFLFSLVVVTVLCLMISVDVTV
jgi:heme o synthase